MNHRQLFRAEGLPVLQNKTFATLSEAIASERGVVCLVEDEKTGPVHNCEFDSNKFRYDANCQNEQSCSQSFQRHLGEVASIVDRHFDRQCLIEVGCGKGYFLEELLRRGYEATGIDPAYEDDSPHISKASLGPGLRLSGDAFVLRQVLEHVVNPLGFLADLFKANDNRGLIDIEVPCFDWICQHRSWFDYTTNTSTISD